MRQTDQELTFNIETPEGGCKTPRWREVAVKNADCPRGHKMIVVDGAVLYAYCPKCRKYYVGSES